MKNILLLISSFYFIHAYTVSTVVESIYGTYTGVDTGTNIVFFDIPYSNNPGRWERPSLPTTDSSFMYNATFERPNCYQRDVVNAPPFPPFLDSVYFEPFSEDCLQLTIIVPKEIEEGKLLPVNTFVHGGGDISGTNDLTSYNLQFASNATSQIYILVKYRLGPAANFPFAGILPANLGLEDLKVAFKFIYLSIESFHGKPNRHVVEGQSAGSDALSKLLIKESTFSVPESLSKLGIRGVSLRSGSPVNGFDYNTQIYLSGLLANSMGCGLTDPVLAIACMKQKSMSEIIEAANTPPLNLIQFVHTDNGPGFPGKVLDLYQQMKFDKDVNMIIGFATHESYLLARFLTGADAPPFSPTDQFIQATNQFYLFNFGTNYTNDALSDIEESAFNTSMIIAHAGNIGIAGASIITEEYFSRVSQEMTTFYEQLLKSIDDGSFLCPGKIIADAVSKTNSKVFMYQWDNIPENPLFTTQDERLISSHGSDLPFRFLNPTLGDIPLISHFSAQEELFAQEVLEMHATFAQTNRPAPESVWPRYEAVFAVEGKKDLMIVLNSTNLSNFEIKKFQPNCAIWNPFLLPGSQ